MSCIKNSNFPSLCILVKHLHLYLEDSLQMQMSFVLLRILQFGKPFMLFTIWACEGFRIRLLVLYDIVEKY